MKRALLLILICLLALSGCAVSTGSQKIDIVATNFAEYDFARAVAGDKTQIHLLIPAGSDMHSFEPTALDIATIADSEMFIYIGGESDSWVEKIIKNIDTKKTKTLKMMEYVSPIADDEHGLDEHIWTSPENAKKMIAAISDSLCEIDKENADYYRQNAEKYIGEIEAEAAATKKVIAEAKHKKIVVADRFPFKYFAEYYGLNYVAAFGGCEHDTDADIATVTRLINAAQKDKLSAVFHIELSTKNVAETVAKATGTEILELHSAHNISATDFKNGVTYLDIMKRNKTALQKGLN